MENHFNSSGSKWTKIYKSLKVLEVLPNCDDYDEDKTTLKYMNMYGINNVRGGSFVSVKLDKSTIDTLQKMNNGTNKKCFICGKSGHFAKECEEDEYSETGSDEEYEEVWLCRYCEKEFTEERKCEYHEKYCNSRYCNSRYKNNKNYEYDTDCCFRCGREGHYASACYATKHINGYFLK